MSGDAVAVLMPHQQDDGKDTDREHSEAERQRIDTSRAAIARARASVVVTKMVNRTKPPGSARHSAAAPVAIGKRNVSANATSPIGRLTRKIDRQPKCSVR